MFNSTQDSDIRLFESLFQDYYESLCLFANRFLNDIEASKEVVSDVFSILWEQRTTANITTSAKSYLYKSVQNRCLNELKRKKIQNKYIEYIVRTDKANNDQFHQKQVEQYNDPLLVSQIHKAIEALPDKCREIFTLSRMQHLSYNQIAEKLSISPKTVENQMGIALGRLRQALKNILQLFL